MGLWLFVGGYVLSPVRASDRRLVRGLDVPGETALGLRSLERNRMNACLGQYPQSLEIMKFASFQGF